MKSCPYCGTVLNALNPFSMCPDCGQPIEDRYIMSDRSRKIETYTVRSGTKI